MTQKRVTLIYTDSQASKMSTRTAQQPPWLICSVVTSPAGSVAKYCDEYLSVCPRAYLRNYTRDLYQFFCACCLWPWLRSPPAGWRNSKEKGQFWVFFTLTMHC